MASSVLREKIEAVLGQEGITFTFNAETKIFLIQALQVNQSQMRARMSKVEMRLAQEGVAVANDSIPSVWVQRIYEVQLNEEKMMIFISFV